MRLLSLFTRFSGVSLSLALALSVFVAEPFVTKSSALAGNSHYGTYHAGKRVKPRAPVASIKRVGVTRSGVRLGNKKRHYNKQYRYNRVEQRNREIALRNLRVKEQNQLRRLKASTRRSGPNGRFLNQRERVQILNDNVIGEEFISSSQGVELRTSSTCPTKHNCGYRIYDDGTGPRIITPGAYLKNDLPDYDGVTGPKIITLD